MNAIINFTQPGNVVDKFNWTLAGDSNILNATKRLLETNNSFYKDYVVLDG